MKANDLTPHAIAGYRGERNANIATSPAWYAHKLGEHFQRSGRPEPRDVRMGRGYKVHGSDMLFSFDANHAITRVK